MKNYTLKELREICERQSAMTYPNCYGCRINTFCKNLKTKPFLWKFNVADTGNETDKQEA